MEKKVPKSFKKDDKKPREGWYEAILSERADEKELLPEFSNEFDKNEWQWGNKK